MAMGNKKEADYRITRYRGQYRVEALDKLINHWYIVRSKITTLQDAVEYCMDEFEPYNDSNTKTP